MAGKDLYAILGVGKSASDKEIRSAYRKLAKDYHPDLNPGDAKAEDKFKEIAAAFSILGDPEKRARYDRGELDEVGQPEQRGGKQQYRSYRTYADTDAGHQYSSSAGYADFFDLSDLFGDVLRHRAHEQAGPAHGADVHYNMEVEFLEAANGATKRVTMPGGDVLDIKVPAGVENGKTLRLKGKGAPGVRGGPAGDALVTITVQPHPLLTREGNDILIEVPIALDEAVLGAKVEVPTIGGDVRINVPKGSQNGQVLRLRGKGIKSAAGTGDQLVRLRIVMPEEIDNELESFFQDWSTRHKYDPRADWRTTR